MHELAQDLCGFVDDSPSPSHAVATLAGRLEEAGFTRLEESDVWSLEPAAQRYVVRDGSSIVAFRVGTAPPSSAGLRMIGAHTDSPTLRVRPRPDLTRSGAQLVGVEVYGGPLTYTWLDRDLTLAGRVVIRADDGSLDQRLVRLPGAPLRIPSLAIHLQRDLARDGLKLDPQQHLVPVWSTDAVGAEGLMHVLADTLGVAAGAVLGHDLVCADTQPAALTGGTATMVSAPRLDNLVSCHAGVTALVEADAAAPTQLVVANDHEEVGSGSAEGAQGSFLADTVTRLVVATEPGEGTQAPLRALARSRLVSADAAHALHPNFADRHEPEHTPRLGHGPVLKVNAGQSYATDADSGAWFAACCADVEVPLQHFVTRGDLPCGGTIGPATATRLGVRTVDVGVGLLAMHSCRETGDARDIAPMVAALGRHLVREGV